MLMSLVDEAKLYNFNTNKKKSIIICDSAIVKLSI